MQRLAYLLSFMKVERIKKNHQYILNIIYWALCLNLVFLIFAAYLYWNAAKPSYRAVYHQANQKTYTRYMMPLGLPLINRQALLEWAGLATVAAYTYNAANYQQQFAKVGERYFTPNGRQAFQAALERSGVIQRLLSKKVIVTAVVNGAPLILRQAFIFGRETWRVQVPILVTYQSASAVVSNSYVVSLLIVRTDTAKQPAGIAIEQFTIANFTLS